MVWAIEQRQQNIILNRIDRIDFWSLSCNRRGGGIFNNVNDSAAWFSAGVEETWEGYKASAFGGGSGTSGDPYKISTAAQLARLVTVVNNSQENNPDVYYVQTKDIDLSEHIWMPIGSSASPFLANFDGGNYTITGMRTYISYYDKYGNPSSNYTGLFGYVKGGATTADRTTIKSINLRGAIVQGRSYTGSIAGYAENVYISACTSDAMILTDPNSSNVQHIGGIVGQFRTDITSRIYRCSFTGTIKAEAVNYVGGIVGDAFGCSTSCHIRQCNFGGNIEGKIYVGGIAGSVREIKALFCVSDGYISSYMGSMGSICGCVFGNMEGVESCQGYGTLCLMAQFSPDINDSSFVAKLNQQITRCGGIVGCLLPDSYIESPLCINSSFVGRSNIDVNPIIGYMVFPNSSGTSSSRQPTEPVCIPGCYGQCNAYRAVSEAKGKDGIWSILPNLNDGLPMNSDLWGIAVAGKDTWDAIKEYLYRKDFTDYLDVVNKLMQSLK